MDKTKRRILVSLTVIFVLGMIGAFVHMYMSMPSSILEAADLPVSFTTSVQNAIVPTLLGVILVMLLGLTLITWLFIEWQRKIISEVVYIEKFVDKPQEESATETVETSIQEEQIKQIQEELNTADSLYQTTISLLCKHTNAVVGTFFVAKAQENKRFLELKATYAYHVPDSKTVHFEFGEGIAGQVAKEGKSIQIAAVPEGYIQAFSGLGETTPSHLLCVPFKNEANEVKALVEVASFNAFESEDIQFVEKIGGFVIEKMTLDVENVS